MKRITDREIRRLLSVRGTPEPPQGLADRIKAEIPEVLQVGGAGVRPEGAAGVPSRSPALRPLWLLAASLLVVIGAGFVAVRFLTPPSDLAREIALGGVVRIEDIVVTVPERSTVEKRNAASAPPAERIAAAAVRRSPAPSPAQLARRSDSDLARSMGVAGTGSLVESAQQAPASEPSRSATADRAEARQTWNTNAAQEKRSERSADEGAPAVAAKKAPPDALLMAGANPAATPVAKGSIVVTVHDADGKPVADATVLLAFSDRPDVGCGFRVTGRGGAATFCCVAPGTYRVCAQRPGYTAATREDLTVPAGRQLSVEVTMERRPAGGGDQPWTCPTPRPATDR
jgi:hypothetical protein